jgi:hypothetical protein
MALSGLQIGLRSEGLRTVQSIWYHHPQKAVFRRSSLSIDLARPLVISEATLPDGGW